jgi:hypothetical protein
MASYILATAITAFMAGCASAIFLMLVIGIRKGDRTQRLPGAENTRWTPLPAPCWAQEP